MKNGQCSHYLDTSDEKLGNWTHFLRKASKEGQGNITAIQVKRQPASLYALWNPIIFFWVNLLVYLI